MRNLPEILQRNLPGLDLDDVLVVDRLDGEGEIIEAWSSPLLRPSDETIQQWHDAYHGPPSLAEVRAAKLAALADRRWRVETQGITVAGARIKTDRESQALLTGAWCACQLNPALLIDWKGEDGWVQIDAVTVSALAAAVSAHVQGCFTAEKTHAEAIAALETVEAVAAYDITDGWPG